MSAETDINEILEGFAQDAERKAKTCLADMRAARDSNTDPVEVEKINAMIEKITEATDRLTGGIRHTMFTAEHGRGVVNLPDGRYYDGHKLGQGGDS